ncbi:hypothetical protein GCM10022140_44520 [Rhodococcus aetherivorans]
MAFCRATDSCSVAAASEMLRSGTYTGSSDAPRVVRLPVTGTMLSDNGTPSMVHKIIARASAGTGQQVSAPPGDAGACRSGSNGSNQASTVANRAR